MAARPGRVRGAFRWLLLVTLLSGIACTSAPARGPTLPASPSRPAIDPVTEPATMRELRRALARWRDAPATLTFRTERQRPGLPLSAHQCLRGFVDDRADIPEALQVCDPAGVATLVWDPSAARFRLDVTEAGTTITAIVVGGRGVMCTPELGCRSRTPRWIVRSFPFHELIEPVEVTLAGAGIDPAAPVTGSRRRAGYGALDCFEVASLGSSVVWCFRDGVLRSLRIRVEGKGPTIAELERHAPRVATEAFEPLGA